MSYLWRLVGCAPGRFGALAWRAMESARRLGRCAQRSVAMIRMFRRLRLPTVQIIGLASFHLYLHRRVRDVKTPFDVADHLPHDLLSLPDALFGHHDVTAARHDARTDHPHVEIVDVEYPRHRLDRGDDAGHVGAGWRAFEQNRRALAENAEAAPQNEHGDQHRHNRIGCHAARDSHNHARDHDAERRDRVAHHVYVRAPHVHIVLGGPVKPHADDNVDDDTGEGDADHEPAVWRLGEAKTRDRLPCDPERNDGERD